MIDFMYIDAQFECILADNAAKHDLFMRDAQALMFELHCASLALN